ncbi:uncharacterized protein STEHIDRAFT_165076 [Stereum hirsutum FP-91666 SS1]|uniref:uncharacterized protein n=1 Tax=Stereum hirsutum (strain FP-91666) TaxID=721885 RepID=UPI000440DF35|nr:uncharacterized protein STEHIDRAFT_165076 [Stereum hirsutum FP-91666 SS1]EIM92880.1 hypothetical protein STEHIDRAFT_165076 [Stereum hirsutum FP-91666 SS1]
MQLLYHLILWLSQLAFVTTPILNSLPFDFTKTLSPVTNFIGLLSGATDSLPLLPIADFIPVLDMSGFWYQRSDLTDSLSFQVVFIPTMAAIVLAIVLILFTHIDDERLAELFLGRIDEHLSTRIDAIHIQVSRNVAVTSPHHRTRKPSSRKGNSIPLRVVHISRDATTCLNDFDDNARELELNALVGFKTYGQIPSSVTAPIESLGDREYFEEPLEEYHDMAAEVGDVVVNVLVSGDPTRDSTPPPPSPSLSPMPSMIPTHAPITTSSHETAVQQSEDSGSTPPTPDEPEDSSIPPSTASSTPGSTSSDIIAITTPDLPRPSALTPDSVANLDNIDADKLDAQDVDASSPGGYEMVHRGGVPSTGNHETDRLYDMLERSVTAKSPAHNSSTRLPPQTLATAVDPMPRPETALTGMKIDIEALFASESASASPVDKQPTTTTDNSSSTLFPGFRGFEDRFASRESEKDTSVSSKDTRVRSAYTESPPQTQQENPSSGRDSVFQASPASGALPSVSSPSRFRKIDFEEPFASVHDSEVNNIDGSDEDDASDAQPIVYHPVYMNDRSRRMSLPDLRSVFLAPLDDTEDSEVEETTDAPRPVNRVEFRRRTPPDFRSDFFYERRRSDSPLSDHCPTVESSPVGPISADEADEILSKLLPARQIAYDADESDFDEDDDGDGDADDWDFHPKSNATTPAISSAPASTIPTALSSAPAPIAPTSLLPTLPARPPRPRVPYAPLKKPGTYRELWDAAHAAHSKGQNWLAARLLPERFPMFWSPTARSWADEVEEDMFREALDAKLIGEGGRARTAEELASPRADEVEEDMPREAFEVLDSLAQDQGSIRYYQVDEVLPPALCSRLASVHRFITEYHFVADADLDYRAGLSGRSTSRRGTPWLLLDLPDYKSKDRDNSKGIL